MSELTGLNTLASPSDVGSDGYTGPYISNNKFQTSVEFGEHEAANELAYLSRMHDTAYAHWEDRKHREAADRLYNERAQQIVGRFPHLAGNAVMYGNYAKRQFEDAATYATFGLPGLVYWGAVNMYNENKMLNGTYLKKERDAVLQLYSRDPEASKYEKWAYGKDGAGPVKGRREASSGGQMQTRQGGASTLARLSNAVDPQPAKSAQHSKQRVGDSENAAASNHPVQPRSQTGGRGRGILRWFSKKKNKVYVRDVDEHKKDKTKNEKNHKIGNINKNINKGAKTISNAERIKNDPSVLEAAELIEKLDKLKMLEKFVFTKH